MTDIPVTDPAPTPVAQPPAASYSSGGLSAEKIVIWLMLAAALGFWIPYMIMIGHGVLAGHY